MLSIKDEVAGIAQIGSRRVGAAVIAVDPYDVAIDKRLDADGTERSRLWPPLFSEG